MFGVDHWKLDQTLIRKRVPSTKKGYSLIRKIRLLDKRESSMHSLTDP